MFRILNIVLCLAFVHTVSSQSINFLSSLESAKTEALSSDKLIFVDVMADWCGPCKLMEKEMNADTSLINYYNKHFVNLKINEKNNEKFLKLFEIKSFPTILFLNKSGQVVERLNGAKNAKYLKDKGVAMQSAKSIYNKDFTTKKGEKFNEEAFLAEISKAISPMSLTARNGYLNMVVQKGQPFAKPLLTKYNSAITFPVFQEAYININDKSDKPLAENLMVSFLTSDRNFQNDNKIKSGCENLSQLTGISKEKVLAYIIAYRDLIVLKPIGMSSDESQYLSSKALLNQYPESADMALLHQAFTEAVKKESDEILMTNLSAALMSKIGIDADYRYHDIMSVIFMKQLKNKEADKSLSQAKAMAKKLGLKFTPILDGIEVTEEVKK